MYCTCVQPKKQAGERGIVIQNVFPRTVCGVCVCVPVNSVRYSRQTGISIRTWKIGKVPRRFHRFHEWPTMERWAAPATPDSQVRVGRETASKHSWKVDVNAHHSVHIAGNVCWSTACCNACGSNTHEYALVNRISLCVCREDPQMLR